ncbi:uncharacterized protein LOC130808112 isoform X1 [Amaranthus tricolor]|uniref:uncharacterized protein LOC130808112 isoform X1 n=1 Tax=Amaranthus tricolor TaxID=29722 RepID=UPI00258E7150|nr:uncharacterized protein LOC130808112 isoform X1 [Amaranthus tricolor]XP_057529552.1 uncharacterized protein LOC130808112 isoform X1 [Amaranthus tricolor]
MNWLQRKIYLYNVTFGLYMLDWWERCLFNTLIIILMWYVFYNGSRKLSEFCNRTLTLNLYHHSSLGYACPQASIKRYLWRGA